MSSSSTAQLEGRRLDGLRVVVDCANGSASELAASVYEGLGADVVAIGCEPDGTNINLGCGSTATDTLARAVVEHQADLGLALDGDADRLLAVGPDGVLVDGDELIALFALDLAGRGQLAGNTVVVTVMTNLGFRLAMEERGVVVKETPVGDRHVLAALDKDGLSLGGEQSGHIIFRRLATTGDGLLTGLVLADLVVRSGRPLTELLDGSGHPGAAGPGQCGRAEHRAAGRGRRGVVGGGRGDGPRWEMPAECSFAPAAPSPWSGSWSRPAGTAWPRPLPSAWGSWSGTSSPRPRPPTADRRPTAPRGPPGVDHGRETDGDGALASTSCAASSASPGRRMATTGRPVHGRPTTRVTIGCSTS